MAADANTQGQQPKMLTVLQGGSVSPPPIWLMRQAGRYLAEYREVRAQAGSFLDLCYAPALAAEVTLQPIRRYGFDAAILFSDILIVPHALGQGLRFAEGEGPRLDPVRSREDLKRLDAKRTADSFGKIYETVARVRAKLQPQTALIGFCGAPWTVATYMVAGRGSQDQAEARLWAYRDRAGFQALIDLVSDVSIEYLSGQVVAGAQVLQVFDSWSGSLPGAEFERWVIRPTARIVAEIKTRHPHVPVIGFPRGAGVRVPEYVEATKVDAVGCDTTMPLADLRDRLIDTRVAIQGNLDPLLLVAGGDEMELQVRSILDTMRNRPHIFNLGHGIVPETPPENVARLIEIIRGAH